MTESSTDLYVGREQTYVKHFVLDSYLERFAHIVGAFWDTITYVDCFSGPWNAQSNQLDDSSFSIALKQLRKAKADLADHGRSVSLRCFFLEKDEAAYERLKNFADETKDAEVKTCNATLEESVDDISKFVASGGPSSFSFILVDPTGWAGLAMDLIKPLLCFKRGEALLTFMTNHILRFAEDERPGIRNSFDRLFGSIDYRSRITGLSGLDREDELVCCFADAIKLTGSFDHVCTTIVLNPERDRTHFHLIYATRSLKGVEVFKQAEKRAMAVMEKARGEARQRRRVIKSGQEELFTSEELHDPSHYDSLRQRHLVAGKSCLNDMLRSQRRVSFDDAWAIVLSRPLVWDSDVKEWIKDWRKQGVLAVEGLKSGERVPKLGKSHFLIWNAGKETM